MDGTRSALIVASDSYSDPGLQRLRAPATDARALAGVLRDPRIGGFEVRTVLNQPAHEVSLAVEEFFADRRPDDLLLLHFSCHGVKDEGGELFFAATNTRLRRLGATAVAAEFVNRRMGRSRSRRVVLLLDCCYAGAFERGMTARAGAGMDIEGQFGGHGRAVITASSAMEYAFEGDELGDTRELAPSVFTSALVEGLETGDADRDQDGLVALDELYDYVYDKVRAATPNQTPGKWTFGVQGELVIARRSRPVTTPAQLPPELQEAVDSPFAGVRTGAVPELARLLRSRHAGLALAARLTLERLTNDDSRATSAAATAALATHAPPTEPPPQPPAAEPPTAEPPAATPAEPPTAAAPTAGSPARQPPTAGTPESKPEPKPESKPGVAAAPGATGTYAMTPIARKLAAAGGMQPPAKQPAATPPKARHPGAGEAPARETPPTGAPVGEAVDPADPAARRVAGGLAIAAAALLLVGLSLPYRWEAKLADDAPTFVWYVTIMAVVALGAGICTLLPATRRLIGPGLLLGAAAGSTDGLLHLLGDMAEGGGGFGSGFWVEMVAHLLLALAACIAGAALVRSAAPPLRWHAPQGPLPQLMIYLGIAGSVALLLHVARIWGATPWYNVLPSSWLTILATVVPAVAATVTPRRFGAALLVGWVGAAAANLVDYYTFGRKLIEESGFDIGQLQLLLFGVSLVALLIVAVLHARDQPAPVTEPAPPS